MKTTLIAITLYITLGLAGCNDGDKKTSTNQTASSSTLDKETIDKELDTAKNASQAMDALHKKALLITQEALKTLSPFKEHVQVFEFQKNPATVLTLTEDADKDTYTGMYHLTIIQDSFNYACVDAEGKKSYLVKKGEIIKSGFGHVLEWYYAISIGDNNATLSRFASADGETFDGAWQENMVFALFSKDGFFLQKRFPKGKGQYTDTEEGLIISAFKDDQHTFHGLYDHNQIRTENNVGVGCNTTFEFNLDRISAP